MSGREKAAMEASSSRREQICRLFQLPYPLILDILSRLPIRDLLRCRCVCKRFLCFVHDPELASLHVSKSPLCILLDTIHPEYRSKRLQFAHVDAEGANFEVSNLKFTDKSNWYIDVSSCNGLVCIAEQDFSFSVCNPILGEIITIQPPYKDGSSDSLFVMMEPPYKDCSRGGFGGLGYSTVTNQCKLLQTYDLIIESGDLYATAEIYTIGTGTWRSIGKAPDGDFIVLPFNAFLNGALHWSNDYPDANEFIVSFDFDAEQFGNVPPPDHFRKDDEQKFVGYPMIGVFGGCLFICHMRNEVQFDIWVMKEYGVKESWTKQFVIENLNPMDGIRVGEFLTPMVVLSNGEILMSRRNAIVCYNLERKEF